MRTIAEDQCFPADKVTFVQLIRAWVLWFGFALCKRASKSAALPFCVGAWDPETVECDFLAYLRLSVMVTREQTGNATDVLRQEKVAPEEKIEQVSA